MKPFFCTDDSAGHTMPHTIIRAWFIIRASSVVSRAVPSLLMRPGGGSLASDELRPALQPLGVHDEPALPARVDGRPAADEQYASGGRDGGKEAKWQEKLCEDDIEK